jgi:hypothetical protein
VEELRGHGLRPALRVLETDVPWEQLGPRETAAMDEARAAGADLLNQLGGYYRAPRDEDDRLRREWDRFKYRYPGAARIRAHYPVP